MIRVNMIISYPVVLIRITLVTLESESVLSYCSCRGVEEDTSTMYTLERMFKQIIFIYILYYALYICTVLHDCTSLACCIRCALCTLS